jgi:hypothetical protein
MKKNLLPLISFCLTVLLLVVCIQQHMELKDYQAQIDFEMDSLRTELTNQMNHLAAGADTVPEETQGVEEHPTMEAGYFVSDFSVNAYYINIEEWMLDTYISVTLNHVDSDMVVTLLAEFDGKTVSVPMSRYNNYSFSANLSIPVDNPNDVDYTIQVEMDGKTTQQSVYAYVDILDLLAIYCSGGDFSGPYFKDGMIYGQCSIRLDNWSGAPEPQPLLDPRFEILKNGEVVQTLEAVQAGEWTDGGTCPYEIKNEDHTWAVEAQEGDRFVLRFRCHNEYGLGWEFYLIAYEIRDGQVYDVELDVWPHYGFYRAN